MSKILQAVHHDRKQSAPVVRRHLVALAHSDYGLRFAWCELCVGSRSLSSKQPQAVPQALKFFLLRNIQQSTLCFPPRRVTQLLKQCPPRAFRIIAGVRSKHPLVNSVVLRPDESTRQSSKFPKQVRVLNGITHTELNRVVLAKDDRERFHHPLAHGGIIPAFPARLAILHQLPCSLNRIDSE